MPTQQGCFTAAQRVRPKPYGAAAKWLLAARSSPIGAIVTRTTTKEAHINLPEAVSEQEWERAHEALLAKEKAHMREGDRLAAERRRQPMHEITKDYRFEGPDGEVSLLDLFEGRRQLALYHFMFGPSRDEGCDGCSMFVDQLTHLAHLQARDTTFALVSRAPLEKLEAFKRRMGWNEIPWYSDGKSEFGVDLGFSPPEPRPDEHQDGESFGFTVFIHDDDGRVYRTYFTNWRGVEAIGTVWSILDRTPLGRQEEWEDIPEGRPRGPKFDWWRYHDRYEDTKESA